MKSLSGKNEVYLHGIETAVPPHVLKQADILEFMQRHMGDSPEKKSFLARIYEGSAIDTRYSVLEDYTRTWQDFTFFPKNPEMEPSPRTAERNLIFEREAAALAIEAAQALFAPESASTIRVKPSEVTHLITVTCTGLSAPGFDLAVQKALGLGDNIDRYHLGFMGCYAAFPALKLARTICMSNPGARVLIVDVELCTLHFQKRWESDLIVANALFADGAAAALVSSERGDSVEPMYRLDDFASQVLGDSEDKMAWIIGDTGFEMKLSSYVPRLIQSNIQEILSRLLRRNGLDRDRISRWAIHPGGRAILDRIQSTLELGPEALSSSYEILRDFGNMSSATIFFVLRAMAESSKTSLRQDAEKVFAAAFGPGLTVESAVMVLWPTRQTIVHEIGGLRGRRTTRRTRDALFFPKLRTRLVATELMDREDVDLPKLRKTIVQFGMLNCLFSAYKRILKKELFERMDASRTYTVLDIGTGGADIARWVVKFARKKGFKVRITCIDPDTRIVPWAREMCRDFPEIEVMEASSAEVPALGDFDFMISNHVMHHMAEKDIESLFRAAASHCRINLVFNDLRRSLLAYVGYTIFTGLFVRGSLAFYDGRLSIRRGFVRAELEAMIDRAGLSNSLAVAAAWPARLYVCWKSRNR